MESMRVTLEVSKLSGWLNADAYCRESEGGHTVRGEVYGSAGGRRWATAVQAACRRGSTVDMGQGTGTVLMVVRVRRKQRARRGSDRRLLAGNGEERTWKM